jgi:D-arabinose 1-dehydrogenase-like Zn-dependent alcohol dehydrogenase
MELAHQGKVRIDSERFPLEDVNDVYQEINAGKILGRAVLIPSH